MAKHLLFILILLSTFRQFAQTPQLSVQTGHTDAINDIKFSPDNLTFATASADNTIILWDLQTGKQICTLNGHRTAVNAIVFHPANKKLYSVSDDGELIIWNLENNDVEKQIKITVSALKKVVLDPAEDILFFASDNIYSYDLKTGKTSNLNYSGITLFNSLDIHPLSKKITFGSSNHKHSFIYDYKEKKEVKKYYTEPTALCFGKNEPNIFTGNAWGYLCKHSADNKKLLHNFRIRETFSRKRQMIFAIETGKEDFYVCNKEKLIYCYDRKGNIKHILKGHVKNPTCMALNKDENLLLTAGEDLRVYVWNTVTGKLITTIEGSIDYISDIGFTKDGNKLALAYQLGSLKMWDLKTNTFINYALQSSKRKWKYNLLKIDSVSLDKVYADAAFYTNYNKTDIVKQVIFYKVEWDYINNEALLKDYKRESYYYNQNVKNVVKKENSEIKKISAVNGSSAQVNQETITWADGKSGN
ncbi:MAG TPA: hypothetical protein VGF30_13150, partial [Bacteroidia bacterium]